MKKLKSFLKSSSTGSATAQAEINLLNSEEIAARRIPVEETEITAGKRGNWLCHYCSRRYTNETTFMKHFCEPRRRAQELMSPIGQAAYSFYCTWMKLKRYSQPSSAAFLESKYYRQFLKFAQLVADAQISKPERYIELMVSAEIMPPLWCRDACYAVYIDWMDKLEKPMDQVASGVSFLLDVCEKENVTMDTVFKHLGAQRLISLVRQRKLSPWLIFCCQSFSVFVRDIDKHQLSALNLIVNASYWAERFGQEKETIAQIKEFVKEVGL